MRLDRLLLSIALICCVGCHWFGQPENKPGPAAAPTTTPAGPPAKLATFDGSGQYGITVSYPADWKPVTDDAAVKVVSPDGADDFFLYYQKLNGFQATFATAARADGDYQDDLKKKWCPDAVATVDMPLSIPDADARKIFMTGHKDGKALSSMAAFIVRKGQVYVMTVESPQGDAAAARVFDQAVASIRWTK